MSEKKMPSLDSLFGGCSAENPENEIVMLKSAELLPFPAHPFKLYEGKRLEDLVESIKDVGILEPIIVMETAGGYIILAGHNRNNANILAGNIHIPAVVKRNISSGESKLIVTHTNFHQRGLSDFLPSERAKAFKLELEGLKEQRKSLKRVKEIEGYAEKVPLELLSRETLASQYQTSVADIHRHLRLNWLSPSLLKLTDEKAIAVRAASDISYLSDEMQREVDNCIKIKSAKLDIIKADRLKKAAKDNILDNKMVHEILFGVAKTGELKYAIKIPYVIINKYFSHGEKQIQITQTIEKALEAYFSTK